MDDYIQVKMDDKFRKLLESIFSEEFMQNNTNFDSFEGFRYSSAVIVNWNSDHMIYSKLLMDNFVKESTRFSTWDEMVMQAADEKFGKRQVAAV